MLHPDVREANKIKFLKLVNSIKRQGANIPALIDWLEKSDFFDAPASTNYHNSVEGGLLDHSLKVYNNLVQLYALKFPEESKSVELQESLFVVAALHDLDKVNKYERTSRNVKVYSEDGDKHDELGKFKWVSKQGWGTRPVDARFVYGSHEMNSEYLARCFIPLRMEESVAILHHMGSMSWDSAKDNIGDVFTRYPLALMLYQADMLATYLDEERGE